MNALEANTRHVLVALHEGKLNIFSIYFRRGVSEKANLCDQFLMHIVFVANHFDVYKTLVRGCSTFRLITLIKRKNILLK